MDNASGSHILAVEDEEEIQTLLRYNLERQGYAVTSAFTGEQAWDSIIARPPDLALLDIMLPGIDGLALLRRIRVGAVTSRIPVIMLTAKGDEDEIVKGLELGADDYVTKPFSPKVLMARVAATLRSRCAGAPPSRIDAGELRVDKERHVATLAGETIDLTGSEFAILYLLLSRRGKVMTRRQIIAEIREGEMTVTDRSIDVHVAFLRKKLRGFGERIITVRGVGYRFDG